MTIEHYSPVIRIKRSILRPYKLADKARFKELFSDEKIHIHMGGLMHNHGSELDKLFERVLQKYNQPPVDRFFSIWGIEVNDRLVGHFELKETPNTDAGELEVVYFLDTNYWGRGLMTDILLAIRSHAEGLDRQITATISPKNVISKRVLEKIGIQKESRIDDEDGPIIKIWANRLS